MRLSLCPEEVFSIRFIPVLYYTANRARENAKTDQVAFKNALLSRLSAEELQVLSPDPELIDLRRGTILAQRGSAIEHVYFLEKGLGSVTFAVPEGKRLQVAMFGSESFAPISPAARCILGLHKFQMLTNGVGYRIDVANPCQAMNLCPLLNELLNKAVLHFANQAAFEAVCLVARSVEMRLAKWILMAGDGLEEDELAVTHDNLSELLGVRRPTVTMTLHLLEGKGFIKNGRGRISIKDRRGLERFARHAYGIPEGECDAMLRV